MVMEKNKKNDEDEEDDVRVWEEGGWNKWRSHVCGR